MGLGYYGKRILMYWEIRGNSDCRQMNGFIAGIGNYIFLERGKPHLSKNIMGFFTLARLGARLGFLAEPEPSH